MKFILLRWLADFTIWSSKNCAILNLGVGMLSQKNRYASDNHLLWNCIRRKTRSPAVARIVDRTGCQWLLSSSKIGDFFISSNTAYATFYYWLIVILTYPTASETRPLIAWNFSSKIGAKPLQMETCFYSRLVWKRLQRPIRWYHRRPSTIYRLATIHPWQTRRTDRRRWTTTMP